ncbi:hypothetical protein [Peribacillus muralis]|uniref:hypothetical protein n=1 Tax=Peribacillus muralis TaxID=264697 RepID=UPI0009F2D9AA|nr:hypothetical protein [Peribacillus muralis]
MKTIEMSEVVQEMMNVKTRMDGSIKEAYKQAKVKDAAEREYRKQLAKEILKLKSEGYQATLIGDIARGNCADLKFERDIAKTLYDCAKDSKDVLKAEASMLQTIAKFQTDL